MHTISAVAADDCSSDSSSCDATHWEKADESNGVEEQQVTLLQHNHKKKECRQVGGGISGRVINTLVQTKCMTVSSWPVESGSKMTQKDCTATTGNNVFEWSSDQYLALASVNDGEKCLCLGVETKGGGRYDPERGDEVLLKPCGLSHTQWAWMEGTLGEGGRFKLSGTNLCIDPQGSMNLDDAPLIVSDCSTTMWTDQKWTLPQPPEPESLSCPVYDGRQQGDIIDTFSQKCIAVGYPHNHAGVMQKDCNAARYEHTFSHQDSYLKLKYDGLCWCLGVDPKGGDRHMPEEGDLVVLKNCKSPWTQWSYEKGTIGQGGRYKLMAVSKDLCIDPEGNMNQEDTPLIVAECTKVWVTDQKWTLPGERL